MSEAWRPATLFTLALSLLSAPEAQASPNRCPDLALVLAVDASGSISDAEFAFQMQGYARAFRSQSVRSAIRSAGTVDIGVVLWGDSDMEVQSFPFRDVTLQSGSEELASFLASIHRRVSGNTGLGNGLSAALDLMRAGSSCAGRRVVNVSGDGKESLAPRTRNIMPLSDARDRARAMGVTVNALAIETEQRDLSEWYNSHLIAGPDSFSMSVSSLDSFGEAVREKLTREISLPEVASAAP